MDNSVRILIDKLNRLGNPQLYKASRAASSTLPKKDISRHISADRALSDFRDHLEWLKDRHIKKNYTNKYLVGQCFGRIRRLKTKSEENAYCRSHFSVAMLMFDGLLQEMRGTSKTVSHVTLKRFREIIMDYLFNVKPLIEHLERQKDSSYEFFSGAKSYSPHSWEVFRLSRQLAYQSAYRGLKFYIDHRTSQIASTFVLRQALEGKFARLISVGFYNSSLASPRMRHEFHYDFIKNNPQYFSFKVVDFGLLKQIYEWCNEIVHRIFQPYISQNAFAHSICRGLFDPVKTAPGAGWSINNAVEISDLSAMQDAFIKHFFQSDKSSEIWCVEIWEPEADVK